MKKTTLFILLISIFSIKSFSQTSPTAFDLSSGSYTFTQWDSSITINPPLTYPANMIFHTTATKDPGVNAVANGDWACSYDLQAGCFFKGEGALGFAFKNITTSQDTNCRVNGTGANVFVGDATLALNTTNCQNITISWVGRMLSSFNYAPPPNQISRFYGIACQYRIGSSGPFTNLPGNYLFLCNNDTNSYKVLGTADTLVSLLPDTCNNQPLVEIRWMYHQTAQNYGGPRPILGVDEINVTHNIPTKAITNTNESKALSLYPNPVINGRIFLNKTVHFTVVDMLGQQITKPVYGKEFNTDNLSKGIYFIKTTDGETIKFLKQ
ncbi:MAG: T9SS type A sorting domain-containing protein [Bacteroidia bacterium]|nr:T9SS type A sorting domain-containing protein [Bacteroidia bacterium]